MAPQKRWARKKLVGIQLRPVVDPAYGGVPAVLPSNQLPTYREVGLAMEECQINDTTSNPVKKVTESILKVYEKASIPTYPVQTVYKKMLNLKAMKIARMKEIETEKIRGSADKKF